MLIQFTWNISQLYFAIDMKSYVITVICLFTPNTYICPHQKPLKLTNHGKNKSSKPGS